MNAILTNLSAAPSFGRVISVAVLRDMNDNVINARARLADQLNFATTNGYTITNKDQILDELVLKFGLGS